MGAFKARGIERTAVRAERTIGPLDSFQMLAGCVFAGEARCGDVHAETMRFQRCFVKYIIADAGLNAETLSLRDAGVLRGAIDKHKTKKLKLSIRHCIKIELLLQSEADELEKLIRYRNDIAHRIHDILSNTSKLELVKSSFDFNPPIYKADALDRLRKIRQVLTDRGFEKLMYMMSFDRLGFELAEKVYEDELKRLDRRIRQQIARERQRWRKLKAQLDLTGTGLDGECHPRHPANHRPAKLIYGDEYANDTGHLTKRGVAICYRLFELGRSPLAVAWLMGMTLRSAERRYANWNTLKGKTAVAPKA